MTPAAPGERADPGAGAEPDVTAGPDDAAAVTRLLGRPPSGAFEVVVRGDGGVPAVIANAPFLHDGTPMPTRYWLVDPALREAVSRVESRGGVRQAEASVPPDRVAEAHDRYRAERDVLIPPDHQGPRPSGGVGGTRQGVKCLHAHLAWWLTGADDPVGEWTAQQIGLHPSWSSMRSGSAVGADPVVGAQPPVVLATQGDTSDTCGRDRLRHQLHPSVGRRRRG